MQIKNANKCWRRPPRVSLCWWRTGWSSPLRDAWKDRTARIVELRKAVTQGAQLRGREQIIRDLPMSTTRCPKMSPPPKTRGASRV
jgi:hypothetical protein